MLEIILPSAIAGGMVKFVDIVVDEEVKMNSKFKCKLRTLLPLLGFVSPLAFLYLSSISVGLSTLWMSIAIACLLSGKIDSLPHRIGFVTYLLGFFLLNLRVDTLFTFFFLPFALIDEVGNNLADSGTVKNKLLVEFFKYRLSLEISVLFFSLFTNMIEIWVSLFFFDLSYSIILLVIKILLS